jgi:hypothetical protein
MKGEKTMENKLKDKVDISTALNETKSLIAFLFDSNVSVFERENDVNSDVLNGMILIFNQVIKQIEDIDEAVRGRNLNAIMRKD